jgi:hypothetical protein
LPTTEGTWRAASTGVWRSFSIASTVLALALGLFLIARRATGDASLPLPLGLLISTTAMLVAWGWLIQFSGASSPSSPLGFWLPLVAILLFAIGLSYPGARFTDWLVWLSGCAAVIGGPRLLQASRRGLPATARKRRGSRVIQNLQRYRSADSGREFVRGILAAEFPPGQRIETLWVGFCPPFEFLPQVTAHAVGNPSVSVKVAQVLHNGAQLEVRLLHPASGQEVANIEISAAEPDVR